MAIRAVWIDIDNTLLDFDAYVHDALKEGMNRFGIAEFSEDMLPVFHRENGKLWRQIERGTLTFEELQQIRFNHVFRALGVEGDGVSFEHFFREFLHEYAVPVEGARDMLEALAALPEGLVLCTASNGPYEQQIHRMEISGMNHYFRHHFISERLGASKPSRAFFEAGMQEMNRRQLELGLKELKPEEVLMLGDSLTSDMAGGRDFGMQTCWFDRSGAGLPEEEPPQHRVETLQEVSTWIKEAIS